MGRWMRRCSVVGLNKGKGCIPVLQGRTSPFKCMSNKAGMQYAVSMRGSRTRHEKATVFLPSQNYAAFASAELWACFPRPAADALVRKVKQQQQRQPQQKQLLNPRLDLLVASCSLTCVSVDLHSPPSFAVCYTPHDLALAASPPLTHTYTCPQACPPPPRAHLCHVQQLGRALQLHLFGPHRALCRHRALTCAARVALRTSDGSLHRARGTPVSVAHATYTCVCVGTDTLMTSRRVHVCRVSYQQRLADRGTNVRGEHGWVNRKEGRACKLQACRGCHAQGTHGRRTHGQEPKTPPGQV
eukprot:365100-Chlamydomonas_euryale.AAC.6